MKKIILACIFMMFGISFLQAQKSYTDYKPVYKFWNTNYIIDKIEYTPERTIIHFRWLTSRYDGGTFYSIHDPRHWVLENILGVAETNIKQTFDLLEIRNVALNNQIKTLQIKDSNQHYDVPSNSFMTCELHFPRLPKSVKEVHLWEGLNYKDYRNHWHAFNLKIKHAKDPELGTEEDMKRRIQEKEKLIFGPSLSQVSISRKKTPLKEAQAQIE